MHFISLGKASTILNVPSRNMGFPAIVSFVGLPEGTYLIATGQKFVGRHGPVYAGPLSHHFLKENDLTTRRAECATDNLAEDADD